MKKNKIIALSDHALSTSGVGTQSRHLFNGLVDKKRWKIRQFGAALKHSDYRTVVVNEDFVIKPVDGFGNKEMLRVALATERPDGLFIFTDPRFFIWLFEMEDEIHQICPIAWWHVWDNEPYPKFNDDFYRATDLINCHSHHTYTQLKDHHPEKTNFIPHAIPKEIFKRLEEEEVKKQKIAILGEKNKDSFVAIWANRNAKRKRPSDVLVSWKKFLEIQEKETGKKDAVLIMHTDPKDPEGPDLSAVLEMLDIKENVFFSTDRIDFEQMNILYNISDICLTISFAEGFGLSTLEAMQTGTPIVAVCTGGLTRQVVDHRDGTENGVALQVETQTLVGSQFIPYIYEDYVSCETIAKGIFKIFNMKKEEYQELSLKVEKYVEDCFSLQTTIDLWDETFDNTIKNWKKQYKRWETFEI
jgi:glycosyltransferase involved in cell wall biosynthesis